MYAMLPDPIPELVSGAWMARVTNLFYLERTHTPPIFTTDCNKWNVFACGWRIDVARP